MSKVELDWGDHGRSFSLKINGKDIPDVVRLTLDCSAGDVPQLTIEQIVKEAHVRVDECDMTIEPVVITTAYKA